MSPGLDFSQEEYDLEMEFIRRRRKENEIASSHAASFGTNNQSPEARMSFLKTRALDGQMLSLVLGKRTGKET
jgi:hypothetical protein